MSTPRAGPYGGSDVGRMYSSSFGGDYVSRGSDVCWIFQSYLCDSLYIQSWNCLTCVYSYKL